MENNIFEVVKNSLGFFLPPIIDMVNKNIPDSRVRFGLSFVVCLLIAIGLNLDKVASNDLGAIFGSVGLIFTQAQVVYKLYWQDSTIRTKFTE